MEACGKLVLFFVLCAFGCVQCKLTLEDIKCGQRTCKQSEYCSGFDKTCQPCSGICDVTHHNYDRSICEDDCQDYLHDLRYVRADGNGQGNENLKATVQQLSKMVTVTLTLVCLMLIVLAFVLCFQLYRWKIKKNITFVSIKNKLLGKKASEEVTPTKTNNIPIPDIKKSDLRLEMPSSGTLSDHSPVTVTTSISRRPAEDSTLDYAYDNPALSASPR